MRQLELTQSSTADGLVAQELSAVRLGELGKRGLMLGFAFEGELATASFLQGEIRASARMGRRRRREFLMGRLATSRALGLLGAPVVPVPADEGRPRFPYPVVGSISHSGGVGVALVGLRPAVSSIGVDIECHRITLRAARRVCAPDELCWILAMCSERERLDRATALFSAKESAYKALSKSSQSSVMLRDLVIEPGPNGFTATLRGERKNTGLELEGGWRVRRGILTWACQLEDDPRGSYQVTMRDERSEETHHVERTEADSTQVPDGLTLR
jgi:4'-phosphopantetheinyl transferase EntD